jgi:hypothetical protein
MVVPDGWTDISDDLPPGGPYTLAMADGIGALQFSPALYRSGALPNVDLAALEGLLADFAKTRKLAIPVISRGSGRHPFVVADFPSADEFLRVWYISNGRDLALVTYVTLEPRSDGLRREIQDAHDIVASLDFKSAAGASTGS